MAYEEDSRYTPKNLEGFDTSGFNPLYDALVKFDQKFPDKNDPPTYQNMQLFLDKAQIQNFFSWYLSQDLAAEVKEYKSVIGATLPATLAEFAVTDKFMTEARKGPPKEKGTHPLSQKEYRFAKQSLEQNPILHNAFCAFDAGMMGYLAALEGFLVKQNHPTDTIQLKIKNTMAALENGAFTKAIIEELGPAIIHDVERHLSADDTSAFSTLAARALDTTINSRSAFESASTLDGDIVKVACPFKGTVQDLFNTGFNAQKDGTFTISKTPQPAGLLTALIEGLAGGKPQPKTLDNTY